jgi:hypothetical protein
MQFCIRARSFFCEQFMNLIFNTPNSISSSVQWSLMGISTERGVPLENFNCNSNYTYRFVVFLLFFSVALLATGCSSEDMATFEVNGKAYLLPEYVGNPHHPTAPQAYAYASESSDLLEYIPCYCGCAEAPFHHSSAKSCFIDEKKNRTDMIVYDSHGAG